MRCAGCDRMLNSYESTRKNKTTGDYYDLCSPCYSAYIQNLADISLEAPMEMVVDLKPIET
jgi:hypothetical protein